MGLSRSITAGHHWPQCQCRTSPVSDLHGNEIDPLARRDRRPQVGLGVVSWALPLHQFFCYTFRQIL